MSMKRSHEALWRTRLVRQDSSNILGCVSWYAEHEMGHQKFAAQGGGHSSEYERQALSMYHRV